MNDATGLSLRISPTWRASWDRPDAPLAGARKSCQSPSMAERGIIHLAPGRIGNSARQVIWEKELSNCHFFQFPWVSPLGLS